ncbi:amidohydrolase [Herbaspirillum seropedicae]|uniref:Aminohydrolase protein n=1 Tax=Herbaspirillum seropedicae (strain SmR1) TaxID=757424 RepID=D8J008_HERSS|nr:M20 aminoacylase family protein [Herbaspirillum seropedicae]ADJ62345.1 aminohydrolase protein [Herbaspirillum seropedicae SmR1]AKN64484.1 amidohydrolase [Herbaspirillum seropedicae]NQE31118.1 amidohydrolase [Herbaspirillum seropedicae]UMU20416.1 amidohydrolase [Herbaspirillum seropedicae]
MDIVNDGIKELPKEMDLVSIRRHLHAHPELRFEEKRTASFVADMLRSYGLTVAENIGGYGVVATLRKGKSTRAIALRADMDALPMSEQNDFSHISTCAGKMHACGHDGHTTMLLGAARRLSREVEFDGTVHFVFQPAEEGGAGARLMIEDGLFERFPADAIFGVHNWPGLPAGSFGLRPGPLMASSNTFSATLFGRGAHGAQPHRSIDPVLAAAQLTLAWQSIVTRNINPNHRAVISVTQLHTGTADNVIPEQATLSGTVRSFDAETLDLIEHRMAAIAEAIGQMFDLRVQFHFERLYPAVVNHPEATQQAMQAMMAAVGAEQVDGDTEPAFASEDFAFYLQHKPGCYAFLGNGVIADGKQAGSQATSRELHSPFYDFNDDIIDAGVAYWVSLVRQYLGVAA